jgi:uncharacterized BrkB/YihY/UPF0761 family membrane protein
VGPAWVRMAAVAAADDVPGLVARARHVAERERRRAEERLARHEGRPLVATLLRIWARDRESAGTLIGSALAFRLFLFFVPFLVFVVGLAGLLSGNVGDDVTTAAGVTGELADQIRLAFAQQSSARWIALVSGLIGMATTGRSLTKVLVAASSLAWQLPVQSKAAVRVIGAVVGMAGGLGLCLAAVNRIRQEFGVPIAGVSFLAVFALYVVIWLVIFALLPAATRDPGTHIPGAALVGLALTGLQMVSQLYLPGQFERSSEIYGAIGVTVVTLGWFFLLGRAVVLGMAVNAVIFERFGSVTTVVFGLPLLRVLPRRSALVRRAFGYDSAFDSPVDSPLGGDVTGSDSRDDGMLAPTDTPGPKTEATHP